jgi:ribonuclease Z
MKIEMSSQGLYATWIHLPSYKILLDCGEGAASFLKNRVFNLQYIALSHDHTDHTAGLLTLINTRNLGMGTRGLPLTILHPPKSPMVEDLKAFITKTQRHLSYPLAWKTMEPKEEILLKENLLLRTFKVQHGGAEAQGYSLIELRRRLKPEFQGLRPEKIQALNAQNVEISETYRKILLAYSGDAWKMPHQEALDTDYLIHDCTFLREEDREPEEGEEPKRSKTPTHASLNEVLQFAREVHPKKETYLHHVSPRYKGPDLEEARRKLPPKIALIPPGRITILNDPTKSRTKNEVTSPRP